MPDVDTPDPVAAQYERWVYPLPVEDLSTPDQRGIRNGADPEWMGHAFWPEGPPSETLRILVVGCGTTAAARYALRYPQHHVMGIDISETSLAHQRVLKDKHGLDNLELHNWRVEDLPDLDQTFDLIDASGMLHHLPDPTAGMKGIASVLSPQGVVFVMVYGKYGRTGVYMLQHLFGLMGLTQTPEAVDIVKSGLSALKKDHPVQDYIKTAHDLTYDAGVVDTFLHPLDRPFTVEDCLNLVSDAELVFQGWMENFYYHPIGQVSQSHPFYAQLKALPPQSLWQAMELMHGKLSTHCFYATHPQRDPSQWQLTFDAQQVLGLIPVWRHDVTRTTPQPGILALVRPPYPTVTLTPAQSALLVQVDGHKTVSQCLDAAGITDPEDVKIAFCQGLFQDLWQLGLMHFRTA